jgi:hypothetical protein
MAIPKTIIIVPENQVQNEFGISINKVEVLSNNVNTITDKAKEEIILIDFFEIVLDESTLLDPITTGNKGNIQGASIVNIPAKTDMRKNNIINLFD